MIEGIQWVVDHHEALGIRVMNLSFSGEPQSFYWDDPLNQAVMSAWEAGIVVVTSAGNTGPTPMTVGVPGNVPYVITVGSVDDNFTPDDNSDDFLSSFSSAGPTYEGFVKPELTAPGGHMLAHMNPDGLIPRTYPSYMDNSGMYFTMSGTSQAAGVISGVAALVLQANPDLTPDDVKCRLLRSAKPVVDAGGTTLYSIFQQGAGLVYAPDAVYGDATGCANVGLDIAADLSGDAHYVGAATQLEDGTFALMNPETLEVSDSYGTTWDGGYTFAQGYTWSGGEGDGGIPGNGGGSTSNDGYTWSGGEGDGGIPGNGGGSTSNDGYTWSGGEGDGGIPGNGGGSTSNDGYTWSGGEGDGGIPGNGGGSTSNDGYIWGDDQGSGSVASGSPVSADSGDAAYVYDAAGRPKPYFGKLVQWRDVARQVRRAQRVSVLRSVRRRRNNDSAARDLLPDVMARRDMGVSEWVMPDEHRRRHAGE